MAYSYIATIDMLSALQCVKGQIAIEGKDYIKAYCCLVLAQTTDPRLYVKQDLMEFLLYKTSGEEQAEKYAGKNLKINIGINTSTEFHSNRDEALTLLAQQNNNLFIQKRAGTYLSCPLHILI